MDLNYVQMNHQFPDEWGTVTVNFRDNIHDGKLIKDCHYNFVKLTLECGIYYITSPRGSVISIPFECVRSISFYTHAICDIDGNTYNYKVMFDFSKEMNNDDE